MDILHIGLGERGRQWFEIVRGRRDVVSVACVDSDAAAQKWAQRHTSGLDCYERLEEALQQVRADAAVVASPLASHAADAMAALEAGLAVMIATPFAPNLAQGVQVMAVAHRTGRPVLVAQNNRYRRCERALRTLLREGKVGTVTHVSCIDRRRQTAAARGGSPVDYMQLHEVAAHHFDSLRGLLGRNAVRVMAQSSPAPGSLYPHGLTTEAFFEMEDHIPIQYYGSLTANRDAFELRIEGEYGALRTDGRRLWWRKKGARFFLPMRVSKMSAADALQPPREGMASLLDQLQAAIISGEVPETHGDDNLWSLAMTEAVIWSDRSDQTVELADVCAAAGMSAAAISQNQDVTP
ncbi:MAG TPA: Gfo/Idh/MocA family oxidoreductase [Candidatus Entotheonella sp.]|jgi:predicted dehydrogenase